MFVRSSSFNILHLMNEHRIAERDLRDLGYSLDTFFTFLSTQLPSNHMTPAGATRAAAARLPPRFLYQEWVDRHGRSISHGHLRMIFEFYCKNTITNALAPNYDFDIFTAPCLVAIYSALFLHSYDVSQLSPATTPPSSPEVHVPIPAKAAPVPNFDTMRTDTLERMRLQATTIAVVHGDTTNFIREWISAIKGEILSRPPPAFSVEMAEQIEQFTRRND